MKLTGGHPFDAATRLRLQATLARHGFHGIMVAVGLVAAVTVWNGASPQMQATEARTDASAVAAATAPDEAVADAQTDADGNVTPMAAEADTAQAAPAGNPLQPLTWKVVEGDTLRSIAAEYSVSMSSILASNKLDNPDLIQPGQELIIPPVDGVVADVKQGETLGQLAERYGAKTDEIARANALPNDADTVVPFERLVVPGKETADRAIGVARHDTGDGSSNAPVGNVDPAQSSRPDSVSYEVQQGDTVGQLATQFGVSIWTILSANSLTDPDLIRPGMHLKVLPVNGVEHEVQAGESLQDIAAFYKVDLGPLIDFNSLADPDNLHIGQRLTIPGAERPQPSYSLASGGSPAVAAASVPAPAVAAAPAANRVASNVATAQRSAAQTTLAQAKPAAPVAAAKPAAPVAQAKPAAPVAAAKPAAKPAAPAQAATKPNTLTAAAVSAPVSVASGGASGGAVVSTAMKYLGARYVFGGTSPAGFDCSGFVWYVHKALGRSVSRGLWGQLNGGPRIALNALQPGDTVFFANTYMPGLSHAGIYIGGGRFIHASDETSGVKISSLSDSYWGPRYIGASRLY
jgi:cell wall-associated NlpC family hydrolase